MKKTASLLLHLFCCTLLFLGLLPAAVQAADKPLPKGSITIQLSEGSPIALEKRTFTFHKLMDVVEYNEQTKSYKYKPTAAYSALLLEAAVQTGAQIAGQDAAEREEALVDYVAGLDATGIRTFADHVRASVLKNTSLPGTALKVAGNAALNADKTSATFSNLDFGFYLILDTTNGQSAAGKDDVMSLCMLNTAEPNATILLKTDQFSNLDFGFYLILDTTNGQSAAGKDDVMSLCMLNTAEPNATILLKTDQPTLTKQILENDAAVGWNDLGDYHLGEAIQFRLDSRVPDMSSYPVYKMVFHDRMEKGLKFVRDTKHPLSVTLEKNGKSVTLKENSSYKVATENIGTDTFQVVFTDLKAALNGLEANGAANWQNARIRIHYYGELEPEALQLTPGRENTAQLEYSNNPYESSETGRTPWDTVVAFTYEIEGLKHARNADKQEVSLSGVQFTLTREGEEKPVAFEKRTGDIYVAKRDTASNESNQVITTGTTGTFTLQGLDAGTYLLKEIKTQTGYRLPKKDFRLVIKPEYTNANAGGTSDNRNNYVSRGDKTNLSVLKETKFSADAQGNAEKFEVTATVGKPVHADIRVENRTLSRLPLTGSTLSLLSAGVGALMVIGWFVLSRREN